MDKNAPIGIFDSGVGGLTVAREVMRQLSDERIVYFGDTARLPYGTKSQDTVIRFSEQIMRFLRSKGSSTKESTKSPSTKLSKTSYKPAENCG